MARPGNKVNHQAISIKFLDWDKISPQLGVGGCTPKPKKLKLDSTKMAEATPKVAETKIGAKLLGKICFKIMRY